MKLATFEVATPIGPERRVGVRDEGADGSRTLVDVTTAYASALEAAGEADPVGVARAHAPPDMLTFLRRGERAFEAARTALEHADAVVEDNGRGEVEDGSQDGSEVGPNGGRLRFDEHDDSVRLLAPLPRPNSIRDFMAFEEHVRNSLGEDPPQVWYDVPVYYKGNPDSVVGPAEDVAWPSHSNQLDYELEVAAIVGKEGRDISADEAEEYVAGYTIFNDFSARDTQLQEMQGRLGPAKGKDFANALGPALVTPDEFDLETATMTAEVNGETWSEGLAGEMYHSFADVVEHVSQDETLYPGDVLGSGTVGEGCGLELGRFLEEGDTVRLRIDGLGALENTIG